MMIQFPVMRITKGRPTQAYFLRNNRKRIDVAFLNTRFWRVCIITHTVSASILDLYKIESIVSVPLGIAILLKCVVFTVKCYESIFIELVSAQSILFAWYVT